MKRLLLCFSLLTSLNLFSQNSVHINTDSVSNRFHLMVTDVITRTMVSDFNVTIYVGYDTIAQNVHAAENFPLQLHPGMQYRIMITKPGFDTLRTDWTQPADSADVYVDLYLRKTGMTKAERREAYRQSRTETHRMTGDEAGFRVMAAPKRRMCSWRVEIFMHDRTYRSAEYVK